MLEPDAPTQEIGEIALAEHVTDPPAVLQGVWVTVQASQKRLKLKHQ